MPTTEVESDLAQFLAQLDESTGVNVRSAVHAWMSGGGGAQVGKLTIRLLGGAEPAFTAATIHAKSTTGGHPDLELSRVLLDQHGVDWLHWSDEFADLKHHGFDPAAKFPKVVFDERLSPPELARLVSGLRDLATMVK